MRVSHVKMAEHVAHSTRRMVTDVNALTELMACTAKKVIIVIALHLLSSNSWPANTAAMRGGCIRRLTNSKYISFKFALYRGRWQSSVYV